MNRRTALLGEAERLASRLFGEHVGRNDVRGVLDLLIHAAGDWDARRTRCLELLRLLPRSWVRNAPRQQVILSQIGPLLDGRRSEEEVRFLLGWAARILYARDQARRRGRRDPWA